MKVDFDVHGQANMFLIDTTMFSRLQCTREIMFPRSYFIYTMSNGPVSMLTFKF